MGEARGKRVLLTGMSGTGKSTVVTALAGLGYRAVDLDEPGWSEYAGPSSPTPAYLVPFLTRAGRVTVWHDPQRGRLPAPGTGVPG